MPRANFAILNVGWTCMRNDLRKHFKQFGTVIDTHIPFNYKTGFNRRFAFVLMKGPEGFEENVLKDCHVIDGDEVIVKLRSLDLPGPKKSESQSF